MSSPEKPVERRTFCLHACQLATTVALGSLLPGCGGSSGGSPTAPGGPSPSPNPTPPPAPTPPPTSPPQPQPPPTPPTGPLGPVVPLSVVSARLVDGALVVSIDNASPLSGVGGAALAQVFVGDIQRNFLLAHTEPEMFTALNGVCTHEGCTVSRYGNPIFECPCHGSRYDHFGTVVRGPAPAALPRYQTQFTNGVLTVRF